jgi:hypothetical protein
MYNIKEMVKDGKKAKITHYKAGELWYETECGFKFPVPVHITEEVGEATFLAEDKAMLLMRYIRKHIKFLEDAEKEEAKSNNKNTWDFPGGPLECPEDYDPVE